MDQKATDMNDKDRELIAASEDLRLSLGQRVALMRELSQTGLAENCWPGTRGHGL
jgi:hypothetical protein